MHDTAHDHAVTFKRRHRKNRPKKQITSTSLQETIDRPTDGKVSAKAIHFYNLFIAFTS